MNLLWVAMETIYFIIAQTGLFFGQLSFALRGFDFKKNGTHEKLPKSARLAKLAPALFVMNSLNIVFKNLIFNKITDV